MKPDTEHLLVELERVDWFSHVGEDVNSDVLQVGSWREAIESARSQEWEDVHLDARNALARAVNNAGLYQDQWTPVLKHIRTPVHELVGCKTKPVIAKHSLPPTFVGCVGWDIGHWAMETEFADVIAPGYFTEWGRWYMRGHFPCGWEGEFPQGRLVIF